MGKDGGQVGSWESRCPSTQLLQLDSAAAAIVIPIHFCTKFVLSICPDWRLSRLVRPEVSMGLSVRSPSRARCLRSTLLVCGGQLRHPDINDVPLGAGRNCSVSCIQPTLGCSTTACQPRACLSAPPKLPLVQYLAGWRGAGFDVGGGYPLGFRDELIDEEECEMVAPYRYAILPLRIFGVFPPAYPPLRLRMRSCYLRPADL